MESKPPLPPKEEIIENLIEIFISVTGFVERKNVSRTSNIATDFDVCDDDITAFIVVTQKNFNLKKYRPEWEKTETTIEAIADLVLDCLSRPAPPPPKNLFSKLWYWFRL